MTARALPLAEGAPPALQRLAALTALDEPAQAAIFAAMAHQRPVPARAELTVEGRHTREPLLILEGWTARVRQLADGRRQLVSFALPGDLVGHCTFEGAVASSTLIALTRAVVCPLPDSEASPTLARAYAISGALDEAHLLAQVTRLGRLNAHERLIDLLLELHDRLELAGSRRAVGSASR